MSNNFQEKKKIAVFFGAKSFEHDISILTGIQAFSAVDTSKYDPFPVYIDMDGVWWTGENLLYPNFYPLNEKNASNVTKVSFVIKDGIGFLQPEKKGWFSSPSPIYFDFALLAFHGDMGEDGSIQGLFDMVGIPYSGCRTLAASIFMDKVATKRMCQSLNIPVLPDVIISRPQNGEFFDVEKVTKAVTFPFPVIVKPRSLGSSIGVSKASNKDELYSAILKVFALDEYALIEPFVENLEEYNISLTNAFGRTAFSAIEKPIRKQDFLSFEDKYKSGDNSGKGGKFGAKLGAKFGGSKFGCGKFGTRRVSEGMLSMTREFTPKSLTPEMEENIKQWSSALFNAMQGLGNPRIDFMCNAETKELFLGEVNPIPGSFSYFLWEKASPKVNFSKLINALIEEGFKEAKKTSEFYKTLTGNRLFL